mmetsp:Transcript_26595/g.32224  ORF Transcript_26595/g.32224 Transcript_26595/m.32224 type:complete len:161 (-) Transcript_26595:247-729(-)
MSHTKKTQKAARQHISEKLSFTAPQRSTLENLAVECATNPSPDNTFQYAFCMSQSSERSELAYALKILDGLITNGYEHQIDCMYGGATALYLLGEYDQARTRCESILRASPDHPNAKELHLACIDAADEKRVRDMATKGATAVAAVGLAVGVAGMLMNKR